MAVTRANVENVLVHRVGPLLTKAGMDGSTVDGTNDDLAYPIGFGLREAGYTTADITSPTSSEVGDAEDDIDEVVDLAEYRTLANILGNLDDVDTTVGPRSEKLSQLAAQVQKRLEMVQKRLENIYGYGAVALETGVITYEFAEHYTGSDDD